MTMHFLSIAECFEGEVSNMVEFLPSEEALRLKLVELCGTWSAAHDPGTVTDYEDDELAKLPIQVLNSILRERARDLDAEVLVDFEWGEVPGVIGAA